MKRLGELRDDLTHAVKSCKDLIELCKKDERTFTEDEREAFDKHEVERDRLIKLIADREDLDARSARTDSMESDLKVTTRKTDVVQPTTKPQNEADTGERRTHFEMVTRYGKLVAFPDTERGQEQAYRAGMWVRSRFFNDDRAARWCKNHMGIEQRALSEGVNTAGGALVPEEMAQAIINLRETYGVFRRHARRWPMGSDTLVIPRKSGAPTAVFIGEGVAAAESDATFDGVTLTAKKLARLSRFSNEFAEDAIIDVADFVVQEFAEAFALKEDQTGFNGTGAQSFAGIVGVTQKIIDGTHTAGAVDATSGTDLFTEVDNGDITNLIGALPAFAEGNAKFFCSKLCAATVFGRLKADAGGNSVETLEKGIFGRYLGYDIVISQVLEASITAINNTVMLLFGDLQMAAALGDRRGFRFISSGDRYMEFDQIGIMATERFDVNVHDLGDNTTAGPIVALIGNT